MYDALPAIGSKIPKSLSITLLKISERNQTDYPSLAFVDFAKTLNAYLYFINARST